MSDIEHWELYDDVTAGLVLPRGMIDHLDLPFRIVRESDYESLRQQLEGAVDAFEDFIAAVVAPTGRLRLAKNDEGDVLYSAVRAARANLAALRGQ